MRRTWTAPVLTAVATFVFAWLLTRTSWLEAALRWAFPGEISWLHPRADLVSLTLEHLAIVAISSGLTILVGVPLGIWVTRRSGREFRNLVAASVDLGQTFPPVAVLALAMPVLGFGFKPTIVALFLYGMFPVVSGTIAGLDSVPASTLEAAQGMGMSPTQVLFRVELPLAARIIMAGIRTSVVINIGTATIGATIGTGGLGVPIIGGLATRNMAYVVEGALPAALLAVLIDAFIGQVERGLTVPLQEADAV